LRTPPSMHSAQSSRRAPAAPGALGPHGAPSRAAPPAAQSPAPPTPPCPPRTAPHALRPPPHPAWKAAAAARWWPRLCGALLGFICWGMVRAQPPLTATSALLKQILSGADTGGGRTVAVLLDALQLGLWLQAHRPARPCAGRPRPLLAHRVAAGPVCRRRGRARRAGRLLLDLPLQRACGRAGTVIESLLTMGSKASGLRLIKLNRRGATPYESAPYLTPPAQRVRASGASGH